MNPNIKAKHVAAKVAKALYWNGTLSYKKQIRRIQPVALQVISEGYKNPYDETIRRVRFEHNLTKLPQYLTESTCRKTNEINA